MSKLKYSMSEAEETIWLLRAKAGDNRAFDQLLGHYRNYLQGYLLTL